MPYAALYGISPSVVAVPLDRPAYRPLTGYWWPLAGGRLSPPLEQFLADGEPPVFVGFGSMSFSGAVVAGLGRRVVVQRGAANLSAEGPDVLVVDDEPHALLFPRVSVVVHHGGAGTTAAALGAGPPPRRCPAGWCWRTA
ncbi:glycosyltransferase [Paractinoplanes durhamensis]|uniref:glycosyltransferase n=1 Tax=Paractinoplanes durhamensis TaxID=113563 RepID=UPI0031DFB414